MRTVGQLLDQKGRQVVTVGLEWTVLEAARLMDEKHIGAVVVTRGRGDEVAGIFSERDLMRRVVVQGKDPGKVRVADAMTPNILTCDGETALDEVRTLMRRERVRHVPVVNHGRLDGIVSIGDLNVVHEKVQAETIHYLEQFMYQA